MDKKIIIFGAGGHCRTVLSLIDSSRSEVTGIADQTAETLGEKIGAYEIKYTWDSAADLFTHIASKAAIAIGDNQLRKSLYNHLYGIGFRMPTLVHNTAQVSDFVSIGEGCQVCMGVLIGPFVKIGSNCIIYTGSIVDHETQIDNHAFIAPGCRIAGRVHIGAGAFIGIGATICEKITIGDNAVVGAGAVVVDHVAPNSTVSGVPARKHES